MVESYTLEIYTLVYHFVLLDLYNQIGVLWRECQYLLYKHPIFLYNALSISGAFYENGSNPVLSIISPIQPAEGIYANSSNSIIFYRLS